MEQFYRQEVILKLLPSKDAPVDIATIHQRLKTQGINFTKKTVERDMIGLRERFPHVRSKASGEGRKQLWWADKALSKLGLLPTDAMNLVMIMDHARRFGMATQVGNLEVLYEFAKSRLQSAERVVDWSKKIISNTRFVTLQPSAVIPEVLQTIQQALLDDHAVEVFYQSRSSDQAKTYRLKPLGLSFQDSNIYLSCSFLDSTDAAPVALPLHRFRAAKSIFDEIKSPQGYDINSVEAQRSLVSLKSDVPINIRLRLNQNMTERLTENPLTNDQKLVKEDQCHWLMHGSLFHSQGLELWLLSQGDSIEVLEPQALRDVMAETAKRMCALYQKE